MESFFFFVIVVQPLGGPANNIGGEYYEMTWLLLVLNSPRSFPLYELANVATIIENEKIHLHNRSRSAVKSKLYGLGTSKTF